MVQLSVEFLRESKYINSSSHDRTGIQKLLTPIVAQMAQLPDADCQRLIDSLRFDLETETSFDLEDIPFDRTLRATDELEAMILEAKKEIASGMARTIEETCSDLKSDPKFLEKLR